MSVFPTILDPRELMWRLFCPRTSRRAAKDFVDHRLPAIVAKSLRDLAREDLGGIRTLDQQRRIAYIYGLAVDGSWAPGWNSPLLSESVSGSAEEVALKILKIVYDGLQDDGD